ncbi:hypothetical protein L596_001254 [Steinernema carpocapsae]|uniref:Protein kinase domain-containing protein n=1 Tax=Steinernema carpocapsae TaxID=34508 RepID=A0A4U8UKY2_STECR|nr:hypothetical protein L596_001254 [Steinernema carpocapsae]
MSVPKTANLPDTANLSEPASLSIIPDLDPQAITNYMANMTPVWSTIDKYNFTVKIGHGTYGKVYRGYRKTDQKKVAVKMFVDDEERVQNMGFSIMEMREVLLIKRIRSDYIVDIIDVVMHVDPKTNAITRYMVMPYYEADLFGVIRSKVVISMSQQKTVMIQLLMGLAALHCKHIMHRDLKTANILISEEGIIKIADFGMAKAFNAFTEGFTPNVVTPSYRGPELLLRERIYGTGIDIWSAGCIMGELLTKKPTMKGFTEQARLKHINAMLGEINEETYPGCTDLPAFRDLKNICNIRRGPPLLRRMFAEGGELFIDLIGKLLALYPKNRITADVATNHSYFDSDPKPVANLKSLLTKIPEGSKFLLKVREKKEPPARKRKSDVLTNDNFSKTF